MRTAFLGQVEACLGDKVARYIANKRRGGDSGQKGFRYEEFYAAGCLAGIACQSMCDPGGTEWPHLAEQADAIVDDLVIGRRASTDYHQCKNVAAITWAGGDHPLQDDFAYQATLSRSQGVASPRTLLVVPTPELKDGLRGSMPRGIALHSDVLDFPYCDGSLNRLVLEHQPLRDDLAALARVDDPTSDALADVFGALLIGIRMLDGNGSSERMFEAAQLHSPHLVRLLPAQMRSFAFEPGFEAAMHRVPGLRYSVDRGFFRWWAFGTSEVFTSNCLSQPFVVFQQRIAKHSPETFDDFESLV